MQEYSVLMSVYQKEKPEYLRQSIESILCQTVQPLDFVIVCDGPLTSALDEVLSSFVGKRRDLFQIVRIAQNAGLGNALNEGMKYCKCDIVARMDSDDIAFPERCERQLLEMDRQNVDLLSATVEEFDADPAQPYARRELPQSHEEILRFARKRNPMNHPCVMYRKGAVEQAGGYQPFYLFEDYYLWVRMLLKGSRTFNVREPLLHMRAGNEMYQRRAGLRYVKSMLSFRWYMKKTGFSGWPDFLVAAAGQTVVCMMPNKMRASFYKGHLRTK